MDSESDARAELSSLKELKDHQVEDTENTPMSFNNGSISFQTQQIDLPSNSHRTPSDFVAPMMDLVDRTRVDYVPLSRSQREFSKETPSVETSPRLAATSRTDRTSPSLQLSTSRLLKANTLNLSCVSSASVSSLPLTALSHIVEQRKNGPQSTPQSDEKSYFQDLSSPIYERTQRWRTSSASRLTSMKAQNLEKEIADCSFAPSLAPKTLAYVPSGSVELRTQQWKVDSAKKLLQTKAKIEEEIASDCPFQPTLFQSESPKSSFDGKKFYTRNVEWQRKVQNRAKGVYEPSKPPPVPPKTVKRLNDVGATPPRLSKLDYQQVAELEEFKLHAASLSKILKGSQTARDGGKNRRAEAVANSQFRLKSGETNRTAIRQELLMAKIALLEGQVSTALKASK